MSAGAARERVARLAAAGEALDTPCGDGRMRWHAWGAGPPLVLLHGGFGSWLHWVRNVETLAREYRVLAADLPGLGDSDLPPEPITPETLGAIVGDGIRRLAGAGPVHLVGFSFGGLVAGQCAARLGDGAATLTLVGASGLGQRRPPLELRRREPDMSPEARDAALRYNLLALMLHDPASADDLAMLVHDENDRRARLRSRRMSLGDSLRRALPEVRARVGAIWGEHDATAGPWLHERESLLRELRPELAFHVVAGAGHWVQYEAAERFDALLTDLVR